MRSTVIHRRGHHPLRTNGEEKKEDCEATIPPTVAFSGDPHHHSKGRRRSRNSYSSFCASLLPVGRQLPLSSSLLREHRKEVVLAVVLFGSLLFYAVSVIDSGHLFSPYSRSSMRRRVHPMEGLSITLPSVGSKRVAIPGPFVSTKEDFYSPDYGEVQFEELKDGTTVRNITYTGNEQDVFSQFEPKDNPVLKKYYYRFDDDVERNPILGWGRDRNNLDETHHCRQTAFHRQQFPTCNDFHAIGFEYFVSANRGRYLGGGAFRDVFLLDRPDGKPYVVLKTASYGSRYKANNYEYYRMDAAVASAVSPHPLVVDIYGSCALAMFSEAMSRGDVDVVSIP